MATRKPEAKPATITAAEKRTPMPEAIERQQLESIATEPPAIEAIAKVVTRILNETVKTDVLQTVAPVPELAAEGIKNTTIMEDAANNKPEVVVPHDATSLIIEPLDLTPQPELVPATLERAVSSIQAASEVQPITADAEYKLDPIAFIETALETEAESAIEVNFDYAEPLPIEDMLDSDWIELAINDILGEMSGEPADLDTLEDTTESVYEPIWFQEVADKIVISEEQTSQLTEELAEYLEPLNPVETESVITLVATVVQIAYWLQEQPPELVGTLTSKVEELKEVCTQLFKALGLELGQEQMELFTRFILHQDQFTDKNTENSQLLLSQLLEEGTYEQKQTTPHILNILALSISQWPKPSLHNLVGRLALKFRMLPHSPKLFRPRSVELAKT